MDKEFFLDWEEAVSATAGQAGGKGWNLGRLVRYGFKIPQGGVLSAGAFAEFVRFNGLEDTIRQVGEQVGLDDLLNQQANGKLEELRQAVLKGQISPLIREELSVKIERLGILNKSLAVRSSATAEDSAGASFAGMHDSFLNVNGLDNILEAVKGCYASLWTPRAVAYRRKLDIPDAEVLPAVVIMEMVNAQSSGIAFSRDPRTGRWNDVVVNAGFGLGEAIVGGMIEPDEYHIDSIQPIPPIISKKIGRKEGMTVAKADGGTQFVSLDQVDETKSTAFESSASKLTKAKLAAAKQVLSDNDIIRLCYLVKRVYAALGEGVVDQDIEWAFDGRDFVLLQARPVTSIQYALPAELKKQPEIWSNGNFKDAIPMVQASLSWDMTKILIEGLLTEAFKVMRYDMPAGAEWSQLIQGRGYLNISLMQWLYYDALGLSPADTNRVTGGHQPEINVGKRKTGKALTGVRLMRLLLAMNRERKNSPRVFAANKEYMQKWHTDLTGLTDRELLDKMQEAYVLSMQIVPTVAMANSAAGGPLNALISVLEKHFPGRGSAVDNALLVGRANVTSAEHGYKLLELAELAGRDRDAQAYFAEENYAPKEWNAKLPEGSPFKAGFKEFLAEYGHRAVYEGDIMNPRWYEDPTYLLDFIRSMIGQADTAALRSQQQKQAAQAWQEVEAKVPWTKRAIIKWWLNQAIHGVRFRERAKSELVRGADSLRYSVVEVGRRLVERGILNSPEDAFYCSRADMFSILNGDWDGTGLGQLAADRKARKEELATLTPPDVIIDGVEQCAAELPAVDGEALVGLGVATGRAKGVARHVRHPHEGGRLGKGEVLVAPSTDPGWTPMFLKASAVVMETGGYLSHGAIVAREYGVPAVVNIPGVMKIVQDGQEIVVDGDEGKIYCNVSV